ncbi:hypothetical protein ACS3HL_003557, partial [Providencia stuartii]
GGDKYGCNSPSSYSNDAGVSIIYLNWYDIRTGLLNTMHIQFHWLGVALGLCAALSNAIRVYVSGALAVKTDPMMRSAIMVTGGAILTSVIVPPTFLCQPLLYPTQLVTPH